MALVIYLFISHTHTDRHIINSIITIIFANIMNIFDEHNCCHKLRCFCVAYFYGLLILFIQLFKQFIQIIEIIEITIEILFKLCE